MKTTLLASALAACTAATPTLPLEVSNSGSRVWTVQGLDDSSYFGRSVSSAGDVNGDGFDDIVIGAEGAAVLFHGGPGGPALTQDWEVVSPQPSDELGWAVASAGDVNGDGFDDVAVGAPLHDELGLASTGAVYVHHGSAAGLEPAPSLTLVGTELAGEFGEALSSAGDVNGDGFDDLIVGAPIEAHDEPCCAGAAYVYLGSATGLSTTPDWTAIGESNGAFFGAEVAGVGDLNGDGFDDVAVQVPDADQEQRRGEVVFVFFGSVSGLPAVASWSVPKGTEVAGAGDVDGDGFDDLLVGDIFFDHGQKNEGAAFSFMGTSGVPSDRPSWHVESNQPQDDRGQVARFGGSVASAGDINADGFDDVVVGGPNVSNPQTKEGVALLYLGSAKGLGNKPYWDGESNVKKAEFGVAVAGAGDVDADGFDDVLIGDRGEFTHRVWLLFGPCADTDIDGACVLTE